VANTDSIPIAALASKGYRFELDRRDLVIICPDDVPADDRVHVIPHGDYRAIMSLEAYQCGQQKQNTQAKTKSSKKSTYGELEDLAKGL
jgi:hypothetical protein